MCSAVGTPTEQDLINLLDQARSRNWKQNVTGMLLYNRNTYLQVLEGEKRDVYSIFNSIRMDPRCERVVSMVDEEITHRDFSDWSMGFKNLESYAPDELFGYSEIFSGKLDPLVEDRRHELAVELLMSFAEDSEVLDFG